MTDRDRRDSLDDLDEFEPAAATALGTSPLRHVPLRAIAASGLLAVAIWWLFVAESSADNGVGGGLTQLRDGIWKIPGLVFQTAAYRDWWDFMVEDPRGFDGIWGTVLEHVQIVGTSMFFATLISVVLGIAGHRVKAVGNFATSLASIALTVPSLALFGILMTIVGTGDRPPIIALTLYSILPILRNTLTGIGEVDSAIVEAAKGVGMSPLRRLIKIELPLAWPVILTGIRVATLLNIGIAAIATLVGGGGLGGYINDALNIWGRSEGYYLMWSAVIFTVLLALAADLLFTVLRALTTSKGLRK